MKAVSIISTGETIEFFSTADWYSTVILCVLSSLTPANSRSITNNYLLCLGNDFFSETSSHSQANLARISLHNPSQHLCITILSSQSFVCWNDPLVLLCIVLSYYNFTIISESIVIYGNCMWFSSFSKKSLSKTF